MAARSNERQAAIITGATLLVVYVTTLAPGLTLWDAGEFQSAVASLGIPHPPGASLWVLIARVWSMALGVLPLPVALNLLSAVATALTGALIAALFARWLDAMVAGISAGIIAGLMLSVWQNATETEVYALSLLAGVLLIAVGEGAGWRQSERRMLLLVYLFGLSIAMHLDAMVAAPAALLLAASAAGDGSPSLRTLLPSAALLLLAVGLGQGKPPVAVAGVVLLAGISLLPLPGSRRERFRQTAAAVALLATGGSAVLFLLVRARHDPALNQGNPSTWTALGSVLSREQYAVPGLWPRRAPLWLQGANVFQYADWQVAFGLDDAAGASWIRTPLSVLFLALAAAGARAHRRRDRRSFRAWLVYLLAGSLGVALILNLQAGPSIGWGVLPSDLGHEARERDYFFVVGFVALAAWAGVGAWSVLGRFGSGIARLAPAVALIPLVGNWAVANRRREPDASLPRQLGEALLASAPPGAVLLLAGDNDSYAVWQAQIVRHLRPDVTPVTLPLLGADWYRDELARRGALLTDRTQRLWRGETETLRDITRRSQALGRPLIAAISVDRQTRMQLAGAWTLRGFVFVATAGDGEGVADAVDVPATDSLARRFSGRHPGEREARDPTARYVQSLLACPNKVLPLRRAAESAEARSLDSICNFR